MCIETMTILSHLDETYGNIFMLLISNDSSYLTRVLELGRKFVYGKIDLTERYSQSIAATKQALTESKLIIDAIREITNSHLKYILSKQVLKYLYLDVQKEYFLYNTILNKALFVLKSEMLYNSLTNKCKKEEKPTSMIGFLEYIDTSTEFKYIQNSLHQSVPISIPDEMKSEVNSFIEEFSEQKKWERKYHELLHDMWPSLIVTLRSFVWDYLLSINKMPDNNQKYLLWELLPYIENII